MNEKKKLRLYPVSGWILAGLCLTLLLLPTMTGGRSEGLDRLSLLGFSLGAVLTVVLTVLNICSWRKKRWGLWIANGMLLAFMAVPLILFGGLYALDNGSSSDQRTVKELGLTKVSASLEARYDDHGGFHGDGVSMEVYGVDEAAVEQMQTLPGWRRGPLDETAVILAYGSSTEENGQRGPYITDQDHRVLAPQKDWDYWYFEDRQAEGDARYSTDVLDRPSLNFTLALYDRSGRLYVFRMDT